MSAHRRASTTARHDTGATRCSASPPSSDWPLLVLFGLVLTPADQNQGESVRMLYLHAPSAWVAYLAFGRHGGGVGAVPVPAQRTRSGGTAWPVPAPRSACCSWRSR